MAVDPDPVLTKYNCLTSPEPKKWELYDLVEALVGLPNAETELKAMWYQMFAYVLLMDAPHEQAVYDKLRQTLATDEVLDAVLKNRYSVDIPHSVREMWAADLPAVLVDWYLPYLTYKDQTDESGLTREVRECRRLLGLGLFSQALQRSERLLDCMPDDENLLLVNIAARVSLPDGGDSAARRTMLTDTLHLIDDALAAAPKRENYLLYYRGLALLGLMDVVGAEKQFSQLLELYPNFELAAFMLKAMQKQP